MNRASHIYRLDQDMSIEGLWFPKFPLTNEGQFLWHRLNHGEILSESETCLLQTAKHAAAIDIVFVDPGIPLLSDRAAQVFRTIAADDIQLVPARVEGDQTAYHVLNAFKFPDCIDWGKSRTMPGVTRTKRPMLAKAAIEKGCLPSANIFRVTPTWLIVTDKVREAIEAAELVGATFDQQDLI